MVLRAMLACGLAAALPGCASGGDIPGAGGAGNSRTASYSAANPIPPRLQWNANNGYCGEVVFISAGLYYGQYVSQYDARALASNGIPQYKAGAQLLIGVNDTVAATRMHLTYAAWNTKAETSTDAFLTWVKGEVLAGYPVAMGVYTNENAFYGKTNPSAGDPAYDHIVSVTGVASHAPLTQPPAYHANDAVTFSDNGLWTGTSNGRPPYLFRYPLGPFQATRKQANAQTAGIYSIASDARNYGIAITGIADGDHETVPVRVAPNRNYESPKMINGSNARPAPMQLVLTVTVSGLEPGRKYNLYRYNAMANVPDSAFNANAPKAFRKWAIVASATNYVVTEHIQSSDEVIYRAVPAAAP
jgi:hypothetical protein